MSLISRWLWQALPAIPLGMRTRVHQKIVAIDLQQPGARTDVGVRIQVGNTHRKNLVGMTVMPSGKPPKRTFFCQTFPAVRKSLTIIRKLPGRRNAKLGDYTPAGYNSNLRIGLVVGVERVSVNSATRFSFLWGGWRVETPEVKKDLSRHTHSPLQPIPRNRTNKREVRNLNARGPAYWQRWSRTTDPRPLPSRPLPP